MQIKINAAQRLHAAKLSDIVKAFGTKPDRVSKDGKVTSYSFASTARKTLISNLTTAYGKPEKSYQMLSWVADDMAIDLPNGAASLPVMISVQKLVPKK